MTPSEAHDSAWKREPEHDVMTVACRHLILKNFQELGFKHGGTHKSHRLGDVWCEYFLTTTRGPRFFADIFARWDLKREPTDDWRNAINNVFVAFEIKPKIYSAGALLRQVRVQEERLAVWKTEHHAADCRVKVVVRIDDPLWMLYRDLSGNSMLLWDGKNDLIHLPSLMPDA